MPVKGIQFSFIPSPNITILQTAVYQCTVSDISPSDSVSIVAWEVNEISSSSPSWQTNITSVGIVVDGIGTHSSTLTIPGDPTLNGTIVQCVASGVVNGDLYVNNSSDALYIQDYISNVNLTAVRLELYMIVIDWNIPYTLPSINIAGYNIIITDGHGSLNGSNTVVNHTNYMHTNYTYSASVPGQYNISVVAFTEDGLDSDIDYRIVKIPEVHIHDSLIQLVSYTITSQLWTINCTVKDSILIVPTPSRLQIITSDGQEYEGAITIDNDRIFSVVSLTTDDKVKRVNGSITLQYDSNYTVTSIGLIPISLFRVQDVILSNSSGSSLSVCFECVFIDGNYTQGCLVVYNGTITDYNGEITITRIEQKRCVDNVYTSEYTITVYDIEVDGTIVIDEPAVHKQLVYITGIIVPSPSASSSSTNIFTAQTPQETVNHMTDRNTTVFPVIAISIPIIASVTILTAIISIVIAVILYQIKKRDVPESGIGSTDSHNSLSNTAIQLNYIETEIIAGTRPCPPASSIDNVQYATLNQETPFNHSHLDSDGIYNKLDHSARMAFVETFEYSTLSNVPLAPAQPRQPRFQFSEVNEPLSYKYVVDHVVSHVPHKWEEFGQALAIIPPVLQEIRDNHPDNDRATFCDVIQEWQTSQIRPFTYKTLEQVMNNISDV